MLNIVEKYTAEAATETEDDGVVAIEYVLVAAAVAAGVIIVFATSLWDTMNTRLDNLFV